MKKFQFYLIFFGILIVSHNKNYAQTPLVDFQFWDTLAYEEDGFRAQKTYLTSINNNNVMVGYFVNEEGNKEGFVFFENYKMLRLKNDDFTNTEFTGINDHGYIVAACYNSPIDKSVFYVRLEDPETGIYNSENVYKNELTEFVAVDYAPMPSVSNRQPGKISNMGKITGSIVYTGTPPTNRYIHTYNMFIEDYANHRYITSSGDIYGTFGNGISSDGNYEAGYYINETNYVPIVWNNSTSEFTRAESVTGKRKINDINNDAYITYEYQTGGIWKGMLAKLNTTLLGEYSIQNYEDFPFNDETYGGSCIGINDSNSIVGYINTAADRTVAYFAVTHEWKVPDFDFEKDVFRYSNEAYYLQTTANHWNDPFIKEEDPEADSSLVSICYKEIVLGWSSDKRNVFLGIGSPSPTIEYALSELSELPEKFDYLSPDFFSYVTLRGRDKVYIGNKIKLNEIITFGKNTFPKFDGFCFGMCMGVMANLKDSALLKTKFLDHFTFPSKKHAKDYILESSAEQKPFSRALGTMQLSQFSKRQYINYTLNMIEKLRHPTNFYSQQAVDTITKGMMDHNTWRILGKLEVSEGIAFPHAVLPYKVIRKPGSDLTKVDSVFAYNPNDPDHYEIYLVQHDGTTNLRQFVYFDPLPGGGAGYDELPYGFSAAVGPSYVELDFFDTTLGSGLDVYEKASTNFNFYISSSANINIENTESGLDFEKVDTNINYSIDGYVIYQSSESFEPLGFQTNSTFLAKTTISEADDGYSFGVDYINGNLGTRRTVTEAGETDIIYHDEDYQRIENPDAIEKKYTISTIYNPDSMESFLEILDFKLNQNDTVSLVNLDQYRFLLKNGNESNNSYKLRVRFLSEDHFFHYYFDSINIDATTNHLILLQPESETHKVIILTDNNQDESYEDTMYINPTGIYEIQPYNMNLTVFPNPSADIFTIQINAKENYDKMNYQVVDVNGKIIYTENKSIQKGSNQQIINLKDQPSGIYYLQIGDGRQLIHSEKLIKL